MESENVGVLLHKLTKYQTLLANSNQNSKMSTYRQKINQYTSKLENLGVNRSTLTQIGGLAGGADYQKVLEGLINEQSKKIRDKIKNINSNVPSNPNDVTDIIANAGKLTTQAGTIRTNVGTVTAKIASDVANVQNQVNTSMKAYSSTIENLVRLIRKLLEELIKLEKELDQMGVPASVDLNGIKNAIADITTALSGFTVGTDIADPISGINVPVVDIDNEVVKTYAELLIDDINKDTTNKFVDAGRHTNLLSVELRQLASLMGLTSSTVDFENKLKAKFSNDGSTGLEKITDANKKTALQNLIDGDFNASPQIQPFKTKFATTA